MNDEAADSPAEQSTALTPYRAEGRIVPHDPADRRDGYTFTTEGRADAKERFLTAVRAKGTVRAGITAAGISRVTYSYWRTTDAAFDAGYHEAMEDYNDTLREEINRRATEGTVKIKKVYFQGDLVDQYEEREYSDSLLLAQAKARMKEYRDGNSGGDGGNGSDKIPLGALRRILEEADAATAGEAGWINNPAATPVVEPEYSVGPPRETREDK